MPEGVCTFSNVTAHIILASPGRSRNIRYEQDAIFRRKRLCTGANFVHVYIEIRDKGILKFNKISM